MLKRISVLTLAILLLFTIVYTPKNMASANAGLAWGPVFVGNLKFYMTNLSLPDDYDPKDYITEPQPTEVTIGVDIYDIQLDDDGNEMLNNTSYIPVLPTVEVVP